MTRYLKNAMKDFNLTQAVPNWGYSVYMIVSWCQRFCKTFFTFSETQISKAPKKCRLAVLHCRAGGRACLRAATKSMLWCKA